MLEDRRPEENNEREFTPPPLIPKRRFKVGDHYETLLYHVHSNERCFIADRITEGQAVPELGSECAQWLSESEGFGDAYLPQFFLNFPEGTLFHIRQLKTRPDVDEPKVKRMVGMFLEIFVPIGHVSTIPDRWHLKNIQTGGD